MQSNAESIDDTRCANPYEPACASPANPCGSHGGVHSGLRCQQE
jgi:hypothetical protein